MAREKKSTPKSRTTVPVASRAQRSTADKAVDKAKERARALTKVQPDRMDIAGVGVIIGVVLIILLAIAVPLRNYYHVQSEAARLTASIAAKQAEKDQLLTEIDKYRSDDYVKQEARRRFGVMAEGETAYRIIDPRMNSADTVTTDKQAEEDSRPWYEVLWGSVAEAPTETEAPAESTNLPTAVPSAPATADPAEGGVAEDPALDPTVQ